MNTWGARYPTKFSEQTGARDALEARAAESGVGVLGWRHAMEDLGGVGVLPVQCRVQRRVTEPAMAAAAAAAAAAASQPKCAPTCAACAVAPLRRIAAPAVPAHTSVAAPVAFTAVGRVHERTHHVSASNVADQRLPSSLTPSLGGERLLGRKPIRTPLE